MPRKPTPAGRAAALRIAFRDARIPGGRLDLTADTSDPEERGRREASVRALLDLPGGLDILAKLRARRLALADVHRAVQAVQLQLAPDLASVLTSVQARPVGHWTPLLGATVNRFLQLVEAKRAPGTAKKYREVLYGMERDFGVERDPGGRIVRDVEVRVLASETAETWLHGPKERAGGRPWDAATQRTAHAIARQVIDLAIEEDEERTERTGAARTLLANLFAKGRKKGVRPPRRPKNRRVRILSRSEIARILWANRGRPEAAWVACGVYGGLRAGEKANLRMGLDVDLRGRKLHIQPREAPRKWKPKSDNGVRDVEISRPLARWIRAHIRAGYAGEHYLFHVAGADRPLHEATAWLWGVRAIATGGIKPGRKESGATDHTFRHTFGSWLAQRGFSPELIAKLMGDDVKTVLDFYLHHYPSDRWRAVESLRQKVTP